MPSSSEGLRQKWGGSHGIGEDKAEGYLQSRGYRLTKDWFWIKPSHDHVMTDEEVEAIIFLIEEWDYGGVMI